MKVFPETALERILDALEHELLEASDADILEAANDLGMKPQMKGSAAFIGLRAPSVAHRPEDFFDAGWMQQVLNEVRPQWLARAASPGKAGPAAAPARATARTRSARRKPPRPPKESTER